MIVVDVAVRMQVMKSSTGSTYHLTSTKMMSVHDDKMYTTDYDDEVMASSSGNSPVLKKSRLHLQ